MDKIFAGWTNNIDYPRIARNSALMYDRIFTQPVCYEFENIIVPALLMIGLEDRTVIEKNRTPENVTECIGIMESDKRKK
ncbi:MAG: hypothetical protein LIO65_03055 [Odoribacter sp.]|nr:hypothetical protein [Odoribacter sp.]